MNIGFIGLGIMGKPMAKNLLKAGHSLVVYDLARAPVEELVSAGAAQGNSPADVAARTEIIITVLPNSPHVKEAVFGANGVASGAKKGGLLIDMSSIDPVAAKDVAAELAKRGLGMLDAPVSGGEAKAIDGSLSIMVGGSEADFARARPILAAMGTSITLVGGVGSGNTVKLVNQMIVSVTLGVVSEAMVFAAKAGVDPGAAYEAIKGGMAGSKVLDSKFPAMLKRNFKPGFKVDLMRKDIRNALGAAEQLGIEMPFSRQSCAVLDALAGGGKGGSDHACMVEYFEQKAGKKLA